MEIALAAKKETIKAVYGSLLQRFPDSIYPEIITEKIIEFAILIKNFDVNDENFATHIVGCSSYSAVREWWDFIVFTTESPRSSDLEFYCKHGFRHWDKIHFIDNLDERALWELSLQSCRRLVLCNKDDCNFNNFNFTNITNSVIHPISHLQLYKINFDLWTNIVFPQNIEYMHFGECKISSHLFTLPQNLKKLDIYKTEINWELFQLPDTIESLCIRETFSPFPSPWDLSKCINLKTLGLDTTFKQDPLEFLLPLSLIEISFKGVTHIPIDFKKHPNLEIGYIGYIIDKPEKEEEDEESSEETTDVSANLFVDSDEESS